MSYKIPLITFIFQPIVILPLYVRPLLQILPSHTNVHCHQYFAKASVGTTATAIVIPEDRSFNDDDSVVFEGEDYDEVDDDDDNSIIYIYGKQYPIM